MSFFDVNQIKAEHEQSKRCLLDDRNQFIDNPILRNFIHSMETAFSLFTELINELPGVACAFEIEPTSYVKLYTLSAGKPCFSDPMWALPFGLYVDAKGKLLYSEIKQYNDGSYGNRLVPYGGAVFMDYFAEPTGTYFKDHFTLNNGRIELCNQPSEYIRKKYFANGVSFLQSEIHSLQIYLATRSYQYQTVSNSLYSEQVILGAKRSHRETLDLLKQDVFDILRCSFTILLRDT